ncbi:hypothetical protein ID1001_10050 [Helicobacter pylori]
MLKVIHSIKSGQKCLLEDSKLQKGIIKIIGIMMAIAICCPWVYVILFFIGVYLAINVIPS